jgi:HEAT repeat protein
VSIAIDALGDLDAHDAATPLINYLTKFWNNADLSKRIARSLGKIGYADIHWKALSEYLKHPNYAVRFEAAQSLFKSGNNAKQILNSSNADGTFSSMIQHVEDPLLQT